MMWNYNLIHKKVTDGCFSLILKDLFIEANDSFELCDTVDSCICLQPDEFFGNKYIPMEPSVTIYAVQPVALNNNI